MLNQIITKGNPSSILTLARERQFGIGRGSSNILEIILFLHEDKTTCIYEEVYVMLQGVRSMLY